MLLCRICLGQWQLLERSPRCSDKAGQCCQVRHRLIKVANFFVTASSSKSSTTTASAHKSGACSPTKQPTSTKQSSQTKTDKKTPATLTAVKPAEPSVETEQKSSGPPNKPSHQARLGLARVLMRKGGDSISEAHTLYEEVISMAPAVHDAYIELADSLIKSDPMKAVDIYSKYPFKVGFTLIHRQEKLLIEYFSEYRFALGFVFLYCNVSN